MSRAVALSRLQELGIRSRDDPAAQPTAWAGIQVEPGALRALHEALHPSLLLLTLAGYHIDHVVLGRPGEEDVLVVTLSPRSAATMSWGEYMEVGGDLEWPRTAPLTVLIWLKLRHGLQGDPVDVPSQTMIGGFPFLALDVDTAASLGAVADRLPGVQAPLRDELVAWIAQAWWNTDWSVATIGLLAALEPDLWTFPRLDDDQDLRRQAFRRLGEAIADDALATDPALRSFLLQEASVRNGGLPPSVRQRLIAAGPEEVQELEQSWNTEAEALWAEMHPEEGADPFRRADFRQLSYCELVFDLLNESLISLAGYTPGLEEAAYGGYDLMRGDNDPAPGALSWTYAGRTVEAEAGADLPTHIDELRRDLDQVGFGPLADGDMADDPTTGADESDEAEELRRSFGAYLEAAVREFQVYAAMDDVARVGAPEELPEVKHPSLATTLLPQPNDQRYTGTISGVLNAETRTLLKMWVERDWHCPVVIEARTMSRPDRLKMRDPESTADKAKLVTDSAIAAAHHNLWRRTQLANASYTFIAWDLTRHYPAPVTRPWGEPVVIARWGNAGSWGGAYGECPWYTWPEAELTPVNLLGDDLDPAERTRQGAFWSTYRVIRAVSEVECQGVLDGMNAWDSAILSGGPVHFTLGLARTTGGGTLHSAPKDCVVYPGELCPALSLLAAENPPEYDRFFGVFGLRPNEPWADPPTAMFSSGHRKYRGWIRLENEAGEFVDPRRVTPQTVASGEEELKANHEDFLLVEVLHHWHWIYRWQMAPRLSESFREITYRLARARLRALLSTPWQTLDGAGPVGVPLGRVFTSEKAVAVLERLHVFSPPTLLGPDNLDVEWLGETVRNIDLTPILPAYNAAKNVRGRTDPATWGDPEEAAAAQWLSTCGLKQPDNDLPTLVRWPIVDSDDDADKGKTYTDRRHDQSLLAVAMEEAPDIGDLPPMAVAPGAAKRASFTVTDRETEPGQFTVFATSANPAVVEATVEGGDELYDLVVEAPEGAAGDVTVTVTARDRRHLTTRAVRVNVSPDEAPPQTPAPPYARPAPIGLSVLRDSFELDDEGLFAQPPDPT